MVRTYDERRPVPPKVIDRLLHAAVRAPSGGFTQGWAFLVLDAPEDIARFREAVTPADEPEGWLAARIRAPLLVVPHSNKDAYLDHYAQRGMPRSEAWWPAPYWDIDAGFASLLILLTAIDEGLGACFFGLPKERIASYRSAFGVPPEFHPIGAISVGYPAEPARDLSARRKPLGEVVHRGRWRDAPQP